MVKNKTVRLAVLLLLCLLCIGCSRRGEANRINETQSSEPYNDVVDSNDDNLGEDQPFAMEVLEQETGYRYLNYLYWDLDDWYTITFQRELVGGTYLIREYFDIFQSGDRIILTASNSYYDVFLIELSEDQYAKICSERGRSPIDIAVAFKMESVFPLPVAYISEYDYDTYFEYLSDDSGDEREYEFVDTSSINSYIDVSSRYRAIIGDCVDLYMIEEGE